MRTRTIFVAALIATALFNASSAFAAQITFLLAGEAYQGPPEFEVLADEVPLARGFIENALDTEVEALTEENVATSARPFTFDLPEGSRRIGIRFLEDKWGGGDLDRNMYVLAASVEGISIPIAAMRLLREGAVTLPSPVLMSLALVQTGDEAIFDLPAATFDVAVPACPDVEPLVVGFDMNSAALREDVARQLRSFADQVAVGCEISITGIVSTVGPKTWNTTLANQRAEAVAKALRNDLEGRSEIFATAIPRSESALARSGGPDRIVIVEVKPTS